MWRTGARHAGAGRRRLHAGSASDGTHARHRDRADAVEFAGRRVRWVRRDAGGAEQTGDTTYGVAVFAFYQLEMLVRALSGARGRTVVVPLVSEGSSEMELDTLTVLTARRALAGVRRRVRFADSAIVSQYDVRGRRRDVAALEIVVRDGGARYTRATAALRAHETCTVSVAGAHRASR